MRKSTKKRLIITGFVVAILVAVAVVLYSVLVFRVTKTTPDASRFPSITPYIDIYLSKDVKSVGSYSLNGMKQSGSVDISGNRIRFTPEDRFKLDEAYSLTFTDINSVSGDSIDYKYGFIPEYVQFSDIPKDIQKASIEKSSSGQTDDPFLTGYFPIVEDAFKIEYKHDSTSDEQDVYVTIYAEVADPETGVDPTITNEEAEAVRNSALKYMRDNKGTPENYQIYYNNQYLNEKYAKDYHKNHSD